MNLEIFKNPDPTGKMSREKFLIKNYPEEYNYIINFCQQHNLEHLLFKQKIYHTINLNYIYTSQLPFIKLLLNTSTSMLPYLTIKTP